MTRPRFEMPCAVCGRVSPHEGPDAVSCSYGPRDLDTRPPAPLRTALPSLVFRCPHCGYCAANLLEADARVRAAVKGEAYRAQLTAGATPELANRFLCAALVSEARGQLAPAGWSRVHAAWACDDKDDEEAARRCREAAIETFREARSGGMPFVEGGHGEGLLLAELLRRAGHLEEAAAEVARALAAEPPGPIARLLAYEQQLIAAGDTACHTVPGADPPAGAAGGGAERPG